MFEEICEIISSVLELEKTELSEGTQPIEDLGANSLDIVDIVSEIEDRFGITILDEDILEFKTIGDIASYVKSKTTT